MRMMGRVAVLLVLAAVVVFSVILTPSAPSYSQTGGRIFLPYIPRDYAYSTAAFPYGVQLSADWHAAVGLAQQMGAGYVRDHISWEALEPSNTTAENFNWSQYDAHLAYVASMGLQPLINISTNPSWAASTTCGPINPAFLLDYASFLQAVVSRYSQPPYNVHYWELYNEPDNTDLNRAWLGGCFGSQPLEYANMLKAAYPAIKAADPQAQVVFGSLAYDWFTTWATPGPFNQSFVEDVVNPSKGNAAAYFDILGVHYYPAFRALWEPHGTDVIGKVNYLRNVLAQDGVSKPIALTEINQWTTSPGSGGSEEGQSRYVVQSYARSMSANLVLMIWYNMYDYNEWGYGLLNSDLSKKPSYTVFQTLARMMSGAIYSGPLIIAGSQPSNVEGYTFTIPGGQQRHIAWSTSDAATTLTVPATRVLVTSKSGTAEWVTDGTDGAWDGSISVLITGSPVYLDVQ